MTLGVARNPYATNVADHLIATAGRLGVPARLIDLPSLGVRVQPRGELTVADEHGPVAVSSLAPYLLFGFPAAAVAARLAWAGVAQVRTEICAQEPGRVSAVAEQIGYPVVVKRAHGAQGRWVRRAGDRAALAAALAELAVEGPGALVVQPEVTEC